MVWTPRIRVRLRAEPVERRLGRDRSDRLPIDPVANRGKSCIVLRGEKRPYLPEKATGLPVGAELNGVYLLHTAMYAKPGPSVRCVFRYVNGETRAVHRRSTYEGRLLHGTSCQRVAIT